MHLGASTSYRLAGIVLALVGTAACEGSQGERQPPLMLLSEALPLPLPFDEYLASEGFVSRPKPAPFDCEIPDDDVDGDGVPNAEEVGMEHPSGPSIAELPFLGVRTTASNFILVYYQDQTLKTFSLESEGDVRSDAVADQIEIRRTFGWDSLGAKLEERFSPAGASSVFRLREPPSLAYFNARPQRADVSTLPFQRNTSGQTIQVDTSHGSLLALLEVRSMSMKRSVEGTSPFVSTLVSVDENGAKRAWTRPIEIPLGILVGHEKSGRFVDLKGLDSLRIAQAFDRGEMFFLETLKFPDLIDPRTKDDLSPLMNESLAKTALLVNKGHDFAAQTCGRLESCRDPAFWRIALRQPGGGGCLTIRDMLRIRFGDEIQFDEAAEGRPIQRFLGLENDPADGEDFRRWIVGIHTEREVADVDLDMELGPNDAVVLYYLRGSDFSKGGGEEEHTPPLIDDWVGVIPADKNDCPPQDRVLIHMDDEDSDNQNDRHGWIGAIRSERNTTFHLCRVQGGKFAPLTSHGTPRNSAYAVLKLDSYCPAGSTEFMRYFDNEDSGNENKVHAERYLPAISNKQGTRLVFCLFLDDQAVALSTLPDLGFSYGVFAGPAFDERFLKDGKRGWVFTDDEDSDNRNDLQVGNPRFEPFVKEIVEEVGSRTNAGGNTRLHIAKVK